MFALTRQTARLYPASLRLAKMSDTQLGDLGSGAGKGGGGGGSIRDSGGAFGRREAALEEEYFHRKQQELLHKLKNEQIEHAEFHKKQIAELEDAVKRHKEALQKITK